MLSSSRKSYSKSVFLQTQSRGPMDTGCLSLLGRFTSNSEALSGLRLKRLRDKIIKCQMLMCRSQWSHGLRHELSSPAPTLRSCFRIPLGAWMFVCVLCAFILRLPRVKASKNTSTVIPASRKRRQKENPEVSVIQCQQT
jgi:hypothetical protein